MSYWPVITILVSLILILFFRRIDKRTINFNKFKRYAEKLSDDFSIFLDKKKGEFQGYLNELNGVVKKAEDTLSRIQAGEGELEKRGLDIKQGKEELNSLKGELEKLRGLKEVISGEIKSLGKSLPSLKKLSRRVQKIGLAVIKAEKSLQNVSSLIPAFERRVDEKTERAIENVTGRILEEARNLFGPLTDEYRQSLDMLRDSQAGEISRFGDETRGLVERAERDISQITETLKRCQRMITKVESEDLRSIDMRIVDLSGAVTAIEEKIARVERDTTTDYLRKAEEGYKKYLTMLEESQSSFREELLRRVEDRAKDLSSYIARLEGRVEDLLSNIKKETDRYGEVLALKARACESEADVLKNKLLSEINEEANRNLLLIKPIVSEINEKFTSYKKDFSSIYEEVTSRLTSQEEQIEAIISDFRRQVEQEKQSLLAGLSAQMQEAREQITDLNQRLEHSVQNATETVGSAFAARLKEYEERILELEGRIGDLKNLARTGEAMIEERIEAVFRDYKPEVDEKIRELYGEVEMLFAGEKEKIVKRLNEIIDATDVELVKKESQLKSFLESIDMSIKGAGERLREQESGVLEEVNRVKLEAREELVRELESLKTLFRDEKERVMAKYRQDLTLIQERIDEVNSQADSIREIVDARVGEALKGVETRVKDFEKSYLKMGEDMRSALMSSMDGLSGDIEELKERVGGLKEAVFDEVRGSFKGFKKEMDEEFLRQLEVMQKKQKEVQGLVDSITEKAQEELEKTHREAEDTLRSFHQEVMKVRDDIEKKVGEIEKRIHDFERETSVLQKAVKFKERVEEDIGRFSEIMAQLNEDKKDILSLRKLIQGLKRDEGDISAKVRQLKSDKKLVQDIAKNAEQAIGLITIVDEKIKLIESEKELLENMESGMKELSKQFDLLKEKAAQLEGKERDIEVSIETITKMKEFIGNIEKRADLLKESFNEVKDREEDIKKRLTAIDEKTGSIMGRENRIEEVLSRFKEMDALVQDIEERTKQLQSTREWLARVESRLTNLTKDAERLVEELRSTGVGAAGLKKGTGEDRPTLLSREAENKVKTVLTLFEQKWTIPEICKVTKMSRGEVELILELNK
ncbi:MAG: SpiroCoCo family coiled-coil protein [Spirochaetota bacterium]